MSAIRWPQQFSRQDWSRPHNQGCQMVQAQLQLHGWSAKRRVVIVRQRIKGGIARQRRRGGTRQWRLDLQPSVHEGERLWDYAVLVTDMAYPLEAVGQLYRDRADCRICQFSGADELKNQWSRARTSTAARRRRGPARWSTTGGVGIAGQTTLYLTPMHGKTNHLEALVANIRKALQHVRVAAEQIKAADPWASLLRYISDRIAPVMGPFRPPVELAVLGLLPDLGSVAPGTAHFAKHASSRSVRFRGLFVRSCRCGVWVVVARSRTLAVQLAK